MTSWSYPPRQLVTDPVATCTSPWQEEDRKVHMRLDRMQETSPILGFAAPKT